MNRSTESGLRSARLATLLSFLLAGFGIACWAPLIPLIKARLGLSEDVLGLLILCLGLGSVPAMLLAGMLATRVGARPVILVAALLITLILPLLVIAPSPLWLALALALFGAALGSIDVAMNIHAIEFEKRLGRPCLSGFHAQFSLGGFAGAGLITLLLSAGLSSLQAALIAAALMLLSVPLIARGLFRNTEAEAGAMLVRPRGIVVLLALLAAITFLIEGAVVDWGALLLLERELIDIRQAGFGFMAFSITMTLSRLFGDALVSRIGEYNTLHYGALVATAGLGLMMFGPSTVATLAGFALLGLGAGNLVPVVFRAAGAQEIMPLTQAVAAVTATGYAGILIGPAAIGWIADAHSLVLAFALLTLLMLGVVFSARSVAAGTSIKGPD